MAGIACDKFLHIFTISCLLALTACSGGGIPEESVSPRLLAVEEQEVVADQQGYPQAVAAREILLFIRDNATNDQLAAYDMAIAARGGRVAAFDRDLLVMQVRGLENPQGLLDDLSVDGSFLLATRNFLVQQDGANNAPRPVSAPRPAPSINGGWWVDAIRVERAWDISEGGPESSVAILDRDLPYGQTLIDEERISRFNYKGAAILPPPDTDPPTVERPETDHGMRMAAFTFGSSVDLPNYFNWFNDGANVCGVDHQSSLVFVSLPETRLDASGRVWVTDLLTALKTATQKSHIVNVPWSVDVAGCAEGEDPAYCGVSRQRQFRASLMPALKIAREKDILFVFSAGNDGAKTDDYTSDYFDQENETIWWERVINVGASTISMGGGVEEAVFSRSGSMVELFAPGEDINFAQDSVEDFTQEPSADGTSYASALVSGVASLVKSVEPTLSGTEIKKIMMDAASPDVAGLYGEELQLSARRALEKAKVLSSAHYEMLDRVTLTDDGAWTSVFLNPSVPDDAFTRVDIVFLIDITGSFSGRLGNSVELGKELVSAYGELGTDAAYGVAAFADYPFYPYGSFGEDDRAFYFVQPVTTDTREVSSALDSLTAHNGEDSPESQLTALYQLATGEGQDLNSDGLYIGLGEIPPSEVGWREGARKVVIIFTDESMHDSTVEPQYPGTSKMDTINALIDAGITVYGIDALGGLTDLREVAEATGGQAFDMPDQAVDFANLMVGTIDSQSDTVSVGVETVSGWNYFAAANPYNYWDVIPGQEIPFEINLAYSMQRAVDEPLLDEVVLWVKANEGVIARYRIPVEVVKTPTDQ